MKMDIITNKPSIGPKIELFQDNNISVRFLFPDGYNLGNLSVKLNKKLDNSLISDSNKQPVVNVIDNVLYVTFSKEKLKLLSAPFVLYIYDTDAAIIGCDCVVSNKTGEYNDIVTEVIIGDETIIEVNAQLNPASTWGNIQGDITNQLDLIEYITDNGLTEETANTLYAPIVHTHTFASLTSKPTTLGGYGITDSYTISQINGFGFLTGITSLQVTNALGYTPVSLSGTYSDPNWITSLSKSKVGLNNVLNVAQEPVITGGTSAQYWRGDKTWVNFPTIPTNNNQLTNGSNFITASSNDVLTNKSGNVSQWTNDSGYLSSITSSQINTALGYTPYNGTTNPNSYLTSASLSGYATESFVSSGYSPLGHTHTFASLTSKPTTLTGYGITDGYTTTQVDNIFNGTTSKTGYNRGNWDAAYGWGDHSTQGYLTSINSSQVTTALGYIPTNPDGTNLQYIAGDGSKILFPTIPNNTNYVDLTTSLQSSVGKNWTSASNFNGNVTFAGNILSSADNSFNIGASNNAFIFAYVRVISSPGTLSITSGSSGFPLQFRLGPLTSQTVAAFQVNTGNVYFQNPNSILTENFAGATFNHQRAAVSSVARAIYLTSTLTAAANNDVLVGVDLSTSFVNGAFTGVKNYQLRANGDVSLQGGVTLKVATITTSTYSVVSNSYLYTYTGAVNSTWTFFTLTGNTGWTGKLYNSSVAGIITVNSSTGSNDFIYQGLSVNTFQLAPGDYFEVISNGSSFIVIKI